MSKWSRVRRLKSSVKTFQIDQLHGWLICVQNREIRQAYDVIKSKAKKFVEDVDLISPEEFTLDGEESEMVIMCMSSDTPEKLRC